MHTPQAHPEPTNPLGIDGIEFIEYASAEPLAFGALLEQLGFVATARHRSREVTLYRQGSMNVIVNADARALQQSGTEPRSTIVSAIALRVRDADAAYRHAVDQGAWPIPTRAGVMEINPEGQLVTPGGLPVLGDGGPITLPANATVEIAADGTISTSVGNAKPQQAGRLKLVTPETPMNRGSDGLFRGAEGDLTADPAARLQSGALEGSNVSAVETMVAMISAARQFEQQMKMLQSAEQKEQAATKLLAS